MSHNGRGDNVYYDYLRDIISRIRNRRFNKADKSLVQLELPEEEEKEHETWRLTMEMYQEVNQQLMEMKRRQFELEEIERQKDRVSRFVTECFNLSEEYAKCELCEFKYRCYTEC